jgi:transcriptional regulator with XRE-family HTH domain
MSMAKHDAVKVTIIHPRAEENHPLTLFQMSEIPPRSKLYDFVPCGLGTPFQERLTSYINRLAWRHHVSPQHLIAQEIVPCLSHSYSRQQLSAFSWSNAMSVNGNGPLAREWVTILEGLTKRSDLHLLTSQYWVGDLPPHKLLREKPAWCPACFAEWKDREMPIYEPLLWTFQAVTTCMKHHRKLEDQCPHCQKRQPFIRLQASLDHCVRCNTWLGSLAPVEEPPNPETVEWQGWVAHALEELHSVGVSSGLPPWEQFFTNLSTSFESKGEQSRLAEMAGLARGQLAVWLRRSHTPTLASLLEFCYVCDVTPLQILTGDLAPLKQVIQEGKPHRSPRARRPFRPVDREHCLKRIQAILDGREEPLGYVQLAQQLGHSGHVLLYHFPQDCALLSKQIKECRRQQKEQRIARIQEEVRQATLTLHAQGVYPSQNKVGDLLSDPNWLFQPEAKATWRALCRELGWERDTLPLCDITRRGKTYGTKRQIILAKGSVEHSGQKKLR